MAKANLHPCYCPWCHKSLDKSVDLGGANKVYQCAKCNTNFAGAAWPGSCPKCRAPARQQVYVTTLEPGDPIPGMELCGECADKRAAANQALAEGGVEFRCADCGMTGIAAGTTDFAIKARADMNKPSPEPLAVTITNCPQCKKADD